MSIPKVSILIPVYNGEQYLRQAIDSILAQTYSDWELVIINDGSTDESKNIINSYADSRIVYIENEQNLALIKTLNKGIDICQGEYIARMDADDISLPKRIAKQVDFLNNNQDYILCGTNAKVIDAEGNIIGQIINLSQDEYLKINLLFSVPFVHPSMMIRRKFLVDNRYDKGHKHVEDYELWCRLSSQGKFANLDEELFLYRWHDTNVSVQHSEYQNRLKDEVVKQNLLKLGIVPSENELYCHKISFELYNKGRAKGEKELPFDDVGLWFGKLIKKNNENKIYSRIHFAAYLWSRWAVMCVSQKKYLKILRPKFVPIHLGILSQFLKLLVFLKKK